jgi:hypothetical protein
MKIKNKSWSPLAISLPGARSMTLAARGTSEISAEDFQSPELQRLFEARSIIVLPEKEKQPEKKEQPAGAESEGDKANARPPEGERE